jgi:hypothetical protein
VGQGTNNNQARLDALAAEIDALQATLADIAAALPLPQLLQALVERAVHVFSCTDGQIVLYEAESDRLVLYACYNLPEDTIGRWARPGEGMCGRVAISKQPLIVDDYLSWEGRIFEYVGPGPYPCSRPRGPSRTRGCSTRPGAGPRRPRRCAG